MKAITIAAAAALLLAACAPKPAEPAAEPATPAATVEPAAPAASIMPPPTVAYTCERGTKLAVKMLGATAEVSVDGAEAVSLPVLGDEGTTYTNGRQTLFVKQGVVSWAIGRMAAETCKPD